jgi:hypothetical protein
MCARVWTMHLTMISRAGRYRVQHMRHAFASALPWVLSQAVGVSQVHGA